ncbi:Glycerophosphoryl diester phosphodiesterase (EC, phage variant [Enterococcus phage 163]|uniref:Glycerophosphoryl diester phosphodiesterase (EC, phage variant) n=1 Tax=Enterococcus phage 163 TaxID=2699794 RepID=A0ACA9ASW9_9CAUD|nr:Glycerophosphoryl diester phosphodiesterase (EC, phage variant [Enterococcus phage 163]
MAGGRRFQAGLGSEHKRLYKEGQQINTLLLAQVIQVNYKYNTVDLLALQHKEVFQNSYANEGRFSARLPMEFGGRNLAGQPYGQVNPIAVGTVVLVGFINSDKDMPIVISVYNNNDVNKQLSRTRFANADPTDMTLAGEMYQKFSLYPSLTYDSIDGDGNRVVTFSGKSFIAFDTKDMRNSPMTDASYGSRYEDLGTSYYNDGELIEPMKGRAPNVLFKHQGILDDDNKPDTHNFMIHINPDGTYRTSMMDTEQDWRTMFEMTPEGKIRLRRQGDTVRLNDGFEIGELGINEEGIVYLRNGDMDLEVREDGIYSQGKLISESVNLDDIYEKLANATFEINKTNESLQILADKSEVQDGKIVNLETEITIVAGKVESKVSATEVQDMIDSSIVDMAEAIKQAQEDADRANQIISDMASDNRLTPSEKLDLLKEWDIVKNEYPTYLAQAELYEVDSTTYTAKYKALETFVTPLLEDMEATSVVDGSIMRKTFSAYYTERINLLNAITKGLKDGLEEAMKKASQASVDATQALADSAQAQIDANNAKQLIADIASDGKLTASEKYQLKKEWDVIVKEYPTTIAQATKYKVNTDNYTAKYKALETFVTPLFANMDETSVVNGEQLRTVFSDYYAVKITLLKSITDIARDELTDYGNRITVAETKITQTSEAITLMASRVETVENDVRTNTAQLKVQADLISQKVTASEVKDAIDNAIDNMSIGGSNLFVINTQTAGLLNENNGTVGTAVDKSVVSNYIKVTARMPYVASLYGNTGTNSIIIAWYDTSKTFISGQAVADSGDFHKTYVAPENAVYARLSYKKSDTVKMKFEVGTKPTDYSPAWDDIKGDQTALEEYIKQVEEQAKQAQQEAENAKNEAENANSAIADMSNDNMLTANEKQQILLQWEEIKTEYPINLDQATKFGVSATQYTTAYNALKTYLDPLLADMTTTSVIIGSTMRSTFNTYYDRRTTLLNRVADLAKQVADQAKNTADKVDDDLNNIGGYNYIGFSSGDHMYPRLMIKNVGYYYIPSTTSAEFVGDMVCLKPKTATVTSVQYDVGNANASVADVGLANYRMKEVKTGQWLTASANLKVVGTGTAYLTIFTLENGSWKASYSDRVSASQGVTRVVAQRQVTDATTGILVRVDGSSITEVHFGNMQLEVGIRSTPWKKSDIDIQEDINNVADDIKDYIGARSDNLITNGFGELGNNTNIGGIFDGADRIVGKGSFRQEEANKSLLFSEHIVIDNKKVYNFDYYMHTLKGVGRSYAMICPYDVDGIRITFPSLGGRNYNSTTPVEFTKLTKPLKVGDTEVFVEDVSLWNGQAPQDYQRSIIMWGYKNSFGYTYPDGTYSQLMQMRTYDIGAVDTTANKITLNKPWAVANPNSSDGIFPVGHTLSPTSDGSTYLYLNGHVNIQVPTTYTKYSHLISGSSEFANTTIIPVETGSIQLGFLLNREATGEKSWLNGLRLRDYTDTYKLNDDVRETQENVDKAQADANKANQSIADLSNDNLVTPNEKLDLKKEWEIIVAEKPKNDAQADKFGVNKTTYGTAYNALNTYLTPILANLTTNSAIVGQTMRDTFKTYYTARTDLLNAIASKAKDLADNAQNTADNIAVGTRNLLIGTQDFSKGKYPGNTHITITDEKLFGNAVMKNDFTAGTGFSDMYQLTTSIIPTGTQYTLSFYAKADIDKTKMSCFFYNPNTTVNSVNNQGGRTTYNDGRSVFVLSTEWTKYWVTWTQTQADRPKSVIIGRKTGGEEPNSAFYMSSPMLVEGNKPQTWMKAPEDIETAINGKEGAWVYSPTAPTNPAIGLVWVDSSKTPNQPKRWVGGETGWVALTPEEVKDLPWGEDGSNLADWVAQAEQKISSDAIINTVLGSEDFTGIFDKKANTEDLNNLASYDDLDAMQAEYERLLKEGIAGIDFSPYVTNTELEQLKDSFTFSVQQAGGVNMLKNSLGFSGLDFWDDDSGRNFYRKNNSVTVTNPNVKFERTADTPNGFKLTGAQDRNGTVRINNVINSNGYWTVSFWLRGSQSGTSNFQMDICDLGTTNFAVTADNDWRKVSLTVNVTNYNQSTHHFVDFQNIAWAYFFIKDFKVEKGITATDWTPAPEDAIVFDPIVTTTQNDQLAKLGFGSGFMVNRAQNAILRQTIELPEAKQGLQYALSFYMNVATFGDTTGLQCGARIYEEGVLKYTVGVTDATQGIPSDYHLYKLVFEPESPNTVIELFVINGAQATVIISGVMYNIGNIALKWQPYPSEIYNTNVKIDINGITVKNNQTDGYTMITPQEFSGYARVNGEMERIFTLNGQVTEVKMLQAEKRITMEPISVFAMNSKETNTIGWAFVASGDVSHTTVSNT